jgi:GNAT-family acetyltransferase (TIGR03103 family)
VTPDPAASDDVEGYDRINRYTRIIVDEALARGIAVEVVDASLGELRLTLDGRTVTTLESLSELTSAVAFRRCDDKLLTRQVLQRAGLPVPRGRPATFDDDDVAFLEECEELVVKPGRGEQGRGITVGVTTTEGLERARRHAREHWAEVLLEERCHGDDVRIVVIGNEVVAAAVRRPASVTGTGRDSVADLVAETSRQGSDATGGASTVPLDDRTRDTVAAAGYALDDVLDEGVVVPVRRTANLHTGGTIDDVTDNLDPALAELALAATRAVDLPVAGIDLIVDSADGAGAVIVEVNEQPGLANHEPRPTAARFVDLLFPETRET